MHTEVLKLTLCKEAFEVMVTGEKDEEYREVSDWIKSRLYSKSRLDVLTIRSYKFVEFMNGYSKNSPRFTAQYVGFERRKSINRSYSNGLVVSTGPVYVIKLGKIVSVENWPKSAR